MKWNDLNAIQKESAKMQYISIRANEDEITEEEANKLYDTSDDIMSEITDYQYVSDEYVDVII